MCPADLNIKWLENGTGMEALTDRPQNARQACRSVQMIVHCMAQEKKQ